MGVFRSILAVVAGNMIFAVSAVLLFRLTGHDPHAPQSMVFMVLVVAYGMAFAAIGGVIATRIAPSRAAMHAALVALLIAAGAAVSLLTSPPTDASWSQWGALIFMAPCAWLVSRMPNRTTDNRSNR